MRELIEGVPTSGEAFGAEAIEYSEPAEVLVELARRGELDPWDIDIAKTTEKFLEYIDTLERQDLRIPARTLLYASILLRMKSDSMEVGRDEELEFPEDFLEDDEIRLRVEDAKSLPKPPIRRRTKRPVTLDELITELKKAEMVGRRREVKESWPGEPAEVVDLSHDEGIEEMIRDLAPVVEGLLKTKGRASFEELGGQDRLMNFVSLLFMANRKQVWLEQEEFYGDISIRRHPGEKSEELADLS